MRSLAKGQLGIKIVPSMSFNRVHTNLGNQEFFSKGASPKLKVGIIYDHPIQEHYYVGTGLLFAFKQATIQQNTWPSKEQHEVQYLQIPILLKLYTSEITLDTRVYIELGGIGEIRIGESVAALASDRKPLIEKFYRSGIAGFLGVGIEYNMSLSTSLFLGISYQRGLANMLKKQQNISSSPKEKEQAIPKVIIYGDLVSLEAGIKF